MHSKKYLVKQTKINLDKPKNLFYATKEGFYGYNLVKEYKYFSWFNQISVHSTKVLGLYKKKISLDYLNFISVRGIENRNKKVPETKETCFLAHYR